MNVVSFFSYKGGVGRTTLLANVGAHMAAEGARIACIDLDINAPGLDIAFEIDCLPQMTTADFLVRGMPLPARDMCVEITNRDGSSLSGGLHVFPFPRGARQRVVAVGNAMNVFLDVLIQTIARELEPDHILVDTRSGFSREAGPVWMNSDKVVLVTRCSYQHLQGTEDMSDFFEMLNANRPERRLEPIVVVNDVPEDMPKERHDEIEDLLEEYKPIMIMENRELRWRDRVIVFDTEFRDATVRAQHLAFRRGCDSISQRLIEQ